MNRIIFEAAKSSGPARLTCDKPRYAVNVVPLRRVFNGRLPDPMRDGAIWGLSGESLTVLTWTCPASGKGPALEFPMADDTTIMLALEDVIYTFSRSGGEKAPAAGG